mgnify:CR=1 FL=1
MTKPGTSAELREQWLQRTVKEGPGPADELAACLPPRLEQQLRHVARHDRAQGVRVSAEMALAEGRRARN